MPLCSSDQKHAAVPVRHLVGGECPADVTNKRGYKPGVVLAFESQQLSLGPSTSRHPKY